MDFTNKNFTCEVFPIPHIDVKSCDISVKGSLAKCHSMRFDFPLGEVKRALFFILHHNFLFGQSLTDLYNNYSEKRSLLVIPVQEKTILHGIVKFTGFVSSNNYHIVFHER